MRYRHFTTDSREAVAAEHPGAACIAVTVNDIAAGYAYPPRVRFELGEKDLGSFRRGADFLNISSVDLSRCSSSLDREGKNPPDRQLLRRAGLSRDQGLARSAAGSVYWEPELPQA